MTGSSVRGLGYRLHQATRVTDQLARLVLDGTGLSPARFSALLHIDAHSGCDQTSLGRALGVNRSGAMKIANRLEALGYVTRGLGRDARSKGLALTPAGKLMLADAVARIDRIDDATATLLDDAERASICALLRRLESAGERAIDDHENQTHRGEAA